MSRNIFYKSPQNGFKTVCLELAADECVHHLSQYISQRESIPESAFVLYANGRQLMASDRMAGQDVCLPNDTTVCLHVPVIGGKGGFGSMLRAIGAQIEKTTNREACRDLTGRRLRDINEEKRIKEWIRKEAQRKEEQDDRRRKKLARLAAKPTAEFNDHDFERQRQEIPEIIDEALQYGLQRVQQSSSGGSDGGAGCSSSSSGAPNVSLKRKSDHKIDDTKNKKKKTKLSGLWMGVDGIDVEDSDEDSHDEQTIDDNDTKELMPSSELTIAEVSDDSKAVEIVDSVDESSQSTEQLSDDKKDTIEDNVVIKVIEETVPKTIDETVINKCSEPIAAKPTKPQMVYEPLDLMDYESEDQLSSIGLDRLRHALTVLGLKCGGTLSERANRLWSVKGLEPKDFPKKLLAKKK